MGCVNKSGNARRRFQRGHVKRESYRNELDNAEEDWITHCENPTRDESKKKDLVVFRE